MTRGALIAAAASLAGCAQIFGIDNTTSPPDVALPPHATLTLKRLSVGASVEIHPLDLTGLRATYYIPDNVETSGLHAIPAIANGNVWDADVPDGVPAIVEFSVPGVTTKYLYAFPNRDLVALKEYYEHPGAVAAPSPATLDVSVTLNTPYVTGQSFALYAIGPWRYHGLTEGVPAPDTNATMIGPASVAYDNATFPSTVGATTVQQITMADRVVALRYVGDLLNGAGVVPAFDQTGTDAIAATLADVPSAPLDVTVDPAAINTRLMQSMPASTDVTMSYAVTASPGYLYAIPAGVQLIRGNVDPTSASSALSASYGNPFVSLGWHTLFTWQANRTRTYTPPALALPATLNTGLYEFFEPAAGSQVAGSVGVPTEVAINGSAVATDGASVTINPNRLVTLGLVAGGTSNTVYTYEIIELVPNTAGTALDRKSVYAAAGPSSDMTIPAGVFTTGKTYTVRASCYRGGFPGVASGDLTMRDLPLSVGFHESGVFTVAAP